MCTFNGEKFVIEQLQSVLEQTIVPDRISIYDDCSTDFTFNLIEKFVLQKSEAIQKIFSLHVNSSNLGYAKNFVAAIEKSTADVIFLCDQDDLWEPNKVEVLLEILDDKAVDMAFSDGLLINSDGHQMNKTVLESYGMDKFRVIGFQSMAFKYLTKRNYINGAAVAIRSKAAKSALPLPCEMPHDYWLALWCSLHGGVAGTPRPLYGYRQHDNNAIGVGSSNAIYNWLGIWRQPTLPRQRELRIWKAVCERIEFLPKPHLVKSANLKLEWLTKIVCRKQYSIARLFLIVSSFIRGDYWRYSPSQAFLRDLVSLIK